jgi:hypothetical protein
LLNKRENIIEKACKRDIFSKKESPPKGFVCSKNSDRVLFENHTLKNLAKKLECIF